MRERRRFSRSLAVAVAFAAVGCGIRTVAADNSLRRSDAEIRAWVLEKTPIGTTRQQVMQVIAQQGWIGHPEFRGVPGREMRQRRYASHYGAELGSYHKFFFPFFIWPCHASAFWMFGPDDQVIDVYVSSWCEGL